MSNDTCQGTKADGEPCNNAPMDGHLYCRHHLPDSIETGGDEPEDDTPDTPKIVEAERKAIDSLQDVGENARSESTRVQAWAEILKHARDRE